jgi:hypothetical protein
MASTKRKLPVLKSGLNSTPAAEEQARPPWQWVGFGTVMIFTAWLPLAYLGAAIVARTGEGSLVGPLLAMLLPLVVAAAGGGFLIGRFGKPAGVREAFLSGLVTGLVGVGLTALSGPFSPLLLVVVVVSTGCAGAGGALGVRGRRA